MSWKLTVTISLVTVGVAWCTTDLQNQCITNYNEEFNNDLLLGTWYRILFFSEIGLLPTSECPTYIYQKPNTTDLKRYEEEYSKVGSPFSVRDNPLHEDGGVYHPYGFLIGNKQAKFFVMDPNTVYYRPPFEVRIYQQISEEFVLYHECNMRGRWKWLMSRSRNPKREVVETAINSKPGLVDKYMERRWFCALN